MNSQENQNYKEFNLNDLVFRYLSYWKWFLFSITFSLSIVLIKLRYTQPLFEASASILIKNEEKGASLSDLPAIQDLGLGNGSKNIDNEIEILTSRRLMTKVVDELNLNIQFFLTDGPLNNEIYPKQPFTISFFKEQKYVDKISTEFIINPISKSHYKLKDTNGKLLAIKSFGKKVKYYFGDFIITPDNLNGKYIGQNIIVKISPINKIVDKYKNELKVKSDNNEADVLTISLKDPVKQKAIDIINCLIRKHKQDAIDDKNQISKNTSDFINERLKFITKELSEVESSAEYFKSKHKLVDVVSEAGIFMDNNAQSEKTLLEINTQLYITQYMIEFMVNHKNLDELIPSNIGISDPSVTELISNYNKLVLERNRLYKSSSEKNPIIYNLENQITSIQKTIKESLKNIKNTLLIQSNEMSKRNNELNSKIANVPKYEREYRNIQRQQQIKETLYLYLLQKREETEISLAITISNTKILDDAYSSGDIVSPKKKVYIIFSLLIGLIIPIIILYLIEILDTKVHGRKDIDKFNIPYLGDIPTSNLKENLVVSKSDSSSVTEAFKLLKTNISFMMKHNSNKSKVIFITSTISKEGKSFVSLNLASTYGLSGKKVLLIGMDLRAPKLQQYLNMNHNIGVSSLLVNDSLKPDDIVFTFEENENISIMPSGPIPPNPAELLASPRISEIFNYAKSNFDIIIVDTAPVGMVTDTLLLTEFADTFIYVVRAQFLDRRLLSICETLYKEKKLPNISILINGSNYQKGFGYGYGYGYGYGEAVNKKASFFEKVKSLLVKT